MVMSLANLVVIAVMGFIVLRRGPDRRVGTVRSARWLRIAALVPLGFPVAINLIFGIGEVASGDPGGGGHLLQAAMTVLLGVLVWMRPLQGGVALIAAATIFAAGMLATVPSREFNAISSALTIVALPQIISGVLFFIAGMLARSATTSGATQDK
jgi:hypothetical protein